MSMNVTFDKDSSGESDIEETGEMPVRRLDYEDEDSSNSDEPADPASLPSESASLGTSLKKGTLAAEVAKTSAQKKPSFIEMVVEAVTGIDDKKGASVPALKAYLRANHGISESAMKANFKKAVLKAEENGLLMRPNAFKDHRGLVGRFKLNPDYQKTKQKSEKLKERPNTSEATNRPRKRKPPAAAVNRKDLKSLQEKSVTVKMAKEKIKRARKSIGLTLNTKPKVAPKKLTKLSRKKDAAPDSPKVTERGRPKSRTTKSTKGTITEEHIGTIKTIKRPAKQSSSKPKKNASTEKTAKEK